MSKSCDPISAFNARIPQITSRFDFDRPWRVVGKADIQDVDGASVDSEIYNGTVITPQGFARLAYHKPTGTICLLVSKTAVNLRGARQKDGRILATYEGLAKSYLVGALRSSDEQTEFRINAQALRSTLHRFCNEMAERTKKHFTLFSGSASSEDGKTMHEIHTNGRLAYALNPQEQNHEIRFTAPTRRENGSFIPVQLSKQNFWEKVTSPTLNISKTISVGKTYAESRHDLAVHWQKVSSRLWDEKSIYADEGPVFALKKQAAGFANGIAAHKKSIGVSAAVGLIVALESHQVGWVIGTFVGGHIIAHQLLERGADGTKHVSDLLKKAHQRRDIEAYPANADVSDFFKMKTSTNIAKLCPHIDLNQINPNDFEFVQTNKASLLPDHDVPEDGMRPASLRGHLISAHQRGFSSSCTLPDTATRVDVFQSGLVRLLHERSDGSILAFAAYRPDACLSDIQRLPPNYKEHFDDGKIVRIEYDRRNGRFAEAFRSQELISHSVMMQEVSNSMLFNAQAGVCPDIKARSIKSVAQTFCATDSESSNPRLYMGGQPPCPPDIRAIL